MENKLVLNVGINDANYALFKEKIIDGKRKVVWRCPYYVRWYNLLLRCYSAKAQLKHPTYNGCTVCEEWLTFSNFKSWMETQDWEGKELDKDLIIANNKIYSPETCIFISSELNRFLRNIYNFQSNCDLVGVYYRNDTKKFAAKISYFGKNTNLGSFENKEDAHFAWLSAKINCCDMYIEHENNLFVSKYLLIIKSELQYSLNNRIVYEGRK